MQEPQPNWFAVYTKPRQEKIALENLERQGFHCFLPMAINPYQRRTESKPRIEPVPVGPGDKVRVFDGPLAGFEGIFAERKGINRAFLLMSLLGTESLVEVDALLLQKAV